MQPTVDLQPGHTITHGYFREGVKERSLPRTVNPRFCRRSEIAAD